MNKGNSNQNTLKTLHSSDDISKNMSTVYSTEMVLFSFCFQAYFSCLLTILIIVSFT